MRIGKPIETTGVAYKDKDLLLDEVRESIGALIRGEPPRERLSERREA